MVDELTQESFQTGKAIVTVSVDLITVIADACKRSEQQNPGIDNAGNSSTVYTVANPYYKENTTEEDSEESTENPADFLTG